MKLPAFGKADPQQIRVTAEQNRLNGFAAIEQAQRQLELTVQQQRAGNQLARDQRRFENELRAEKRQARAEQTAHIREVGQTIGRRGLITGPILAPMVVAWVGQIGFATDTLNWPLAGALVFAASWELTTAFAGWMFHQARSAGDAGTLFRAATWLFASAAGAMNYWHALDGAAIDHPTPKAVSYGAMSLVGIALWELYSSLVHRQGLRARGALPPARPKFGMARWLRFPRITFNAWSLAIRDGLSTTESAWGRAASEPITWTQVPEVQTLPIPDLLPARSEVPAIADSADQVPDPNRSETHEGNRSELSIETQIADQVRDLVRSGTQASDPDPTEVSGPVSQEASGPQGPEEVQTPKTQTGPKKKTRTRNKPLDRIDEARAVDASYLAEHGRHIPAEKLARALRIAKPAALELVKQVRGAHMTIAK
jgi:hypothetical protein